MPLLLFNFILVLSPHTDPPLPVNMWEVMVLEGNQADKFRHFTLSLSEVPSQSIKGVLEACGRGWKWAEQKDRKKAGFSLVGAGEGIQIWS